MYLVQINQPTIEARMCLRIVIVSDEKRLEVIESRRTALLQELDRVCEEIVQVRVEFK
jgi:hypothetical protein